MSSGEQRECCGQDGGGHGSGAGDFTVEVEWIGCVGVNGDCLSLEVFDAGQISVTAVGDSLKDFQQVPARGWAEQQQVEQSIIAACVGCQQHAVSCEASVAGDSEEEWAGEGAVIESDGGGANGRVQDLQQCCDGVAGLSEPAEFFGGDIDIGGGAPAGNIDAAGCVVLLSDLQDVEWCGCTVEDPVGCVADGVQVVLECEGVTGPCGNDGDGCAGGRGALHESIDDFVDGAVTADGGDAVEVVQLGFGGDACGVTGAAGGADGELAAGLLEDGLQLADGLRCKLQAAAGVDDGQYVLPVHSCGYCLLC